MGPKMLQKRISNLHHKFLTQRLRAADTKPEKGLNDRRWDSGNNYTWNVDDDEEIPGTVRIALNASDPQRSKSQVVFSIPDRCFIPALPLSTAIELFDQDSSSIFCEPDPPSEVMSVHESTRRSDSITDDMADIEADFDPLSTTRGVHDMETNRSEPMTDRDGEDTTGTNRSSTALRLSKRKGVKGINHFSFCDRATQTTVPPIRSQAMQSDAPSRVSFTSLTNAWIIYDSYQQDYGLQQLKIQQQQAQTAAETTNSKGGGNQSIAAPGPTAMVAAPADPGPPATFLLPQTNEMELGAAATARLEMGSRVIERMLNQNTFDEIAQDFKYWEDGADEYREPEGTLMPLWRFSPPAALLRMYEENGSMRHQVPSNVTAVCWNPHYKDLFAMGLASRDNMSGETGLVCVFSLKSPTQPERSAQLLSGVSSLDFHPEYFQLLAVGMHDGHVSVCDMSSRKNTNLIVYRSSVLRGKRTVPITQVSWVGDVNEGNLRLFSISIDGCLCLWLFVQGELYPTELITLPFHVDNRQIDASFSSLNLAASCSCMAIHPNRNMVLVGTDQGYLWPVSNEGEILTPPGPIIAHQGPVYKIEWNAFHHQIFMTCGTDWTVKIWDQREREVLVVINLGSCAEDCTFSPFSSTAFACISSQGKISIYDLNICLHKPLCSQRIAPQRRSQPTKLSFAPFHPVLLVGDDKGHATCLKLSPNLRKTSRVPEAMRSVDVEIEKLERVMTLMKK